MTPLHHLHAALAGGNKKRAPVSLDIGLSTRVRFDGPEETKPEIAKRLEFLWNMHEGIPTDVLEKGAIREFYDAVNVLCAALRDGQVDFAKALAAAHEVERKWGAITIEPCDGKRAACDCSEAA